MHNCATFEINKFDSSKWYPRKKNCDGLISSNRQKKLSND